MHPIKKSPLKDPAKRNSVALKAFFKITDKWSLTSGQESVLLGIPLSTLYRWKQKTDGTLAPDTLERISYVLGIYKALRILLPNEEAANAWIKKANAASLFNGKSALDKLMKGHVIDLADVRRYLDAERGW
jgi:uncharacterized protein (DUF2384 family)